MIADFAGNIIFWLNQGVTVRHIMSKHLRSVSKNTKVEIGAQVLWVGIIQ